MNIDISPTERNELQALVTSKLHELTELRNNFAADKQSVRVRTTAGIINLRIAILRELEIKLHRSADHGAT